MLKRLSGLNYNLLSPPHPYTLFTQMAILLRGISHSFLNYRKVLDWLKKKKHSYLNLFSCSLQYYHPDLLRFMEFSVVTLVARPLHKLFPLYEILFP